MMSKQEAINQAAKRILAKAWADWQEAPFVAEFDGIQCGAVTNGHALLASSAIEATEPLKTPRVSLVRGLLEQWGDAPASVDLLALRRWIGEDPAAPPCAECNGTLLVKCSRCAGSGKVTHQCDCPHCFYSAKEDCGDCGGTGKAGCHEAFCNKPEPADTAVFFGIPVDRRLLRRALPRLDGAALVSVGPNAEQPIVFRGDDWRLVVMGMREPTAGAPRFPEEVSPCE